MDDVILQTRNKKAAAGRCQATLDAVIDAKVRQILTCKQRTNELVLGGIHGLRGFLGGLSQSDQLQRIRSGSGRCS